MCALLLTMPPCSRPGLYKEHQLRHGEPPSPAPCTCSQCLWGSSQQRARLCTCIAPGWEAVHFCSHVHRYTPTWLGSLRGMQCGNTCGDNETCTFVDIPAGTDPNNQCLCDAGFADCDGIRSNGRVQQLRTMLAAP